MGLLLAACSGAPNEGQAASGVGGSTGTGGHAMSAGGGANGAGSPSNGGGGTAGGGSTAVGGNGGGSAGTGVSPKIDGGSPGCTGVFAPTGAPPTLTPGTWTDISVPGMTKGSPDSIIGTGMANDPCNPAVLYWCNEPFTPSNGGLFKSTDAGATWRKIGQVKPNFTGTDHLDEPIAVNVDPNDPQHIYVGDGVRGNTTGFWVSTDGGENFMTPQGYLDVAKNENASLADVYDVAVDPSDSNHVLVTYHSAWGWTDSKWNTDAGVAESKDGGASWTLHPPMPGWGYGHAINFLYDPARGVGDSRTWLLGTQGAGQWRTTNSGATWTKVTDHSIMHGGGTIYYAKNGTLYATSVDTIIRSTDNGASWTGVGSSQANNGYSGILGDGNRLFTGRVFGPISIRTSLESDGATWTDYNTQMFGQGPFQLAFDQTSGIMYASMWNYGMWALKVK
jgi:hypothetical protein